MVINYQLQLHQDNVNLTTLHTAFQFHFKIFVSTRINIEMSLGSDKVRKNHLKFIRRHAMAINGLKTQSAANSFEMELSWNNQLAH